MPRQKQSQVTQTDYVYFHFSLSFLLLRTNPRLETFEAEGWIDSPNKSLEYFEAGGYVLAIGKAHSTTSNYVGLRNNRY